LPNLIRIGALAVLTCGLPYAPAFAHKLNILAQTDGDRITGLVYYSGGDGAAGAAVHVMGPGGEQLGQTTTDATGAFAFTPVSACDHTFVCESDDGHREEYTVPASQLPARLRETAPAQTSAGADAPPAAGTPALVEQAVARQIQPLRADLARNETRARLRDIVGGIGYIFGVMGLVFYLKARARMKGGPRA